MVRVSEAMVARLTLTQPLPVVPVLNSGPDWPWTWPRSSYRVTVRIRPPVGPGLAFWVWMSRPHPSRYCWVLT